MFLLELLCCRRSTRAPPQQIAKENSHGHASDGDRKERVHTNLLSFLSKSHVNLALEFPSHAELAARYSEMMFLGLRQDIVEGASNKLPAASNKLPGTSNELPGLCSGASNELKGGSMGIEDRIGELIRRVNHIVDARWKSWERSWRNLTLRMVPSLTGEPSLDKLWTDYVTSLKPFTQTKAKLDLGADLVLDPVDHACVRSFVESLAHLLWTLRLASVDFRLEFDCETYPAWFQLSPNVGSLHKCSSGRVRGTLVPALVLGSTVMVRGLGASSR